jgi:hypothetical protein
LFLQSGVPYFSSEWQLLNADHMILAQHVDSTPSRIPFPTIIGVTVLEWLRIKNHCAHIEITKGN